MFKAISKIFYFIGLIAMTIAIVACPIMWCKGALLGVELLLLYKDEE